MKADRILKRLEWYDKVKYYFKPFNPDIKKVSIIYNEKQCEIRQHITVTDKNRVELSNIKIPKYEGFRIKEVIDDEFDILEDCFYLDDDVWKCNIKSFTNNESFQITLAGILDYRFLNQIVRVQPAKNRDQTDDLDRYWLDVMIKRADIWELIWKKLDVQDIDINVNVSLDRCFTPLFPPDLVDQIAQSREITHRFLEAGRSTDTQKMSRAWWEFRRKMREQILTGDIVVDIGRKLIEPDVFPSYIEVDQPFRIGKVHNIPQLQSQSLPNNILVTTQTDLNNKQHFATGYLNFKKKLFIDILREEIGKIS